MANRAYLLAVEDKTTTVSKDPSHEVLAEGINEIPVFWASLFVKEDRVIDTCKNSDEGDLQIPNWCVSADVAKERLARLQEPVGRLLDEKSKGIWSKWVQHVSTIGAGFFKTNAAEVWALDPDGYDKYWNNLLKLFAEPSVQNLANAVRANELVYEKGAIHWSDAERTACKLAGADHIRDVPWLRDLPAADPATAGDLERKRQYDEIMREAQQHLVDAERSVKIRKLVIVACVVIGLALAIWFLIKR